MKAVIIIDSEKSENVRKKAGKLVAVLGQESIIVDLGNGRESHENYFYLKSLFPDVVITLNLAGFGMKTTGDVLAYNTFTCPMAHILTDAADKFTEELCMRQNLSMFTYFCDDEKEGSPEQYIESIPNMRRYDKRIFENNELIAEWLDAFLADCMLK